MKVTFFFIFSRKPLYELKCFLVAVLRCGCIAIYNVTATVD